MLLGQYKVNFDMFGGLQFKGHKNAKEDCADNNLSMLNSKWRAKTCMDPNAE